MQHEYRLKREDASQAYRAAVEKDETILWMEEMKFLLVETNGKDPDVVFWIKEEKAWIKAKYKLQSRNEI